MPNIPITEWYANLKASVKHNVDAVVKPPLRFYKSLLDTVNQHSSDISQNASDITTLQNASPAPAMEVRKENGLFDGANYGNHTVATLTSEITFIYMLNINAFGGTNVILPALTGSDADKTVFVSNINNTHQLSVTVSGGGTIRTNQSGTTTAFALTSGQTGMFSCKSGEWIGDNIG